MAKPLMRRCLSCGRYTLKPRCPGCGGDTRSAHPARFSPDDKYARYRLAERYDAEPGGGGGSAAGRGGDSGAADEAAGGAADEAAGGAADEAAGGAAAGPEK